MSRILRLFAIIVLLFLIAIAWFWWNRPKRVDMAAYVPADSIVYLESNSLTDVAGAITDTDAWRSLSPQLGIKPAKQNNWLTYLAKTTGLGSARDVIAMRAQIAFVLLDLSSTGDGDALEFKSQAALIVETHTSAGRIKPVVEETIGEIAGRAYVHPKLEHANVEGNEFIRWIAPDGQRRIVASVDGSVVVVGNDERAVSACLAARRGQRPSLLHQADLEDMRTRLKGTEALAFGYISSPHAARLVSEGAPVLLGRLSQGAQLQKLLGTGSSKILGNVGWSVQAFTGGIQDSYFVDLKPEVVARLRSAFLSKEQRVPEALEFLPADVYSVTSYNMRDSALAWDSFNAAVSAQLDVVSAVVFTTAFRALLAPYGIDDPDAFLKAIQPEVLTVRLDPRSERALVIAHIGSANSLHQFVSRRFGAKPRSEKVGDYELLLSPDETYAASFAGDYFLLGAPEDVRRSLAAHATHVTIASTPSRLDALTHYLERPSTSNIVTCAKDNERLRAFVSTLASIRGNRNSIPFAEVDRVVDGLPYATSETTLGNMGFERRTRSAFGQLGALVSFLTPEPVASAP